jgi:DNA-binding LytR/AlgR family response regulator
MSVTPPPRALIAEDEPLLAAALQHELARAWPALHIVATVGDGRSAVREALALQPEVLFFDIRMPGQSGLDAAVELADAWPTGDDAPPFPALVFVTAYDQYAVQAFEAHAVDYLLKPVQAARLQKTVQKLQNVLVNQASKAIHLEASLESTVAQLRQLLAAPGVASAPAPTPQATATDSAAAPPLLTLIQASHGSQIHMVPVAEVLYFEAADKYVRVLTAGREYLIRTPLKELTAQLDPHVFWQIHRSTLVRANAITTVTRDEAGKLQLELAGRPEKLPVSRLYAHLFKAM